MINAPTLGPERPPAPHPRAPRRRAPQRVRRARSGTPAPIIALGAIASLLFLLPLAGIVVRLPWSTLGTQVLSPEVLTALWLSLLTSTIATALCLVLGVPLSWLLVRTDFPGRGVLRAIVTLPVVLPPVVGGVALLLIFGRNGFLGEPLYAWTGLSLPFTTAGTVLAQTFVAMPFLILSISGALQSMDRRLEEAARTLSAGRWTVVRRVTLPAIGPSLAAGAVLCWARALGEFGATITFAGNFPGRTQTLPLAVYGALEQDLDAAITLSAILLLVSLSVLVGLRRYWFGVR